jgi:carboxylesterase type B
MSRLREIPARQLVAVQSSMKFHEFRPVADGSFINENLINSINDGSFARRLKDRGIKIMNGEVADEHYLYGVSLSLHVLFGH